MFALRYARRLRFRRAAALEHDLDVRAVSPWLDRERWSVLGGRFVLEFDPVPGRWFVIDPDDWRAGATATGHFSKWDALKAVRLMLDSEAGAHQNPVA